MTKLIEKKPLKFQSKGKTPYTDKSGNIYDNYAQYLTFNKTKGVIPEVPTLDMYKSPLDISNVLKSTKDLQAEKYAQFGIKPISNLGEEKDYESGLSKETKSQLTFDMPSSLNKEKGSFISSLIKPVIATTSALFNLSQLKKTRDEALNLKSPKVLPAITAIRPIQSLAPEIKELYIKNLAGMQVKKTADATSNRIAEQMLDANKMTALDKLTAAEVDNLFKERQRHDQAEAMNAQENVKALNKESEYGADIANKQAAIKSGYEAAKQDFVNKWLDEAIVQPMEKRIEHNLGVETIQNSEEWNRLQTLMIQKMNELHNDPNSSTAKDELNALYEKQQKLAWLLFF